MRKEETILSISCCTTKLTEKHPLGFSMAWWLTEKNGILCFSNNNVKSAILACCHGEAAATLPESLETPSLPTSLDDDHWQVPLVSLRQFYDSCISCTFGSMHLSQLHLPPCSFASFLLVPNPSSSTPCRGAAWLIITPVTNGGVRRPLSWWGLFSCPCFCFFARH